MQQRTMLQRVVMGYLYITILPKGMLGKGLGEGLCATPSK